MSRPIEFLKFSPSKTTWILIPHYLIGVQHYSNTIFCGAYNKMLWLITSVNTTCKISILLFQFINIDINNNFQAKLHSHCIFFKKSFGLENYILMFRRSMTANFSRLRITAHSLMIEKGRHFKMPLENRTCKLCDLNEVEDETHFMIKCSYYSDFRDKMLSDIADALSFYVPFWKR